MALARGRGRGIFGKIAGRRTRSTKMNNATAVRQRQAGETSGSARRAPHQVADLPLGFDLRAELAQLRAEETWLRHGHNAKTLVKEGDLRVVLMTLRCGMRIDE